MEHAVKSVGKSYICSLCGKSRGDLTAMKSHMEAIHFPNEDGYSCSVCHKICKTKHALACHISRYHKNSEGGSDTFLKMEITYK